MRWLLLALLLAAPALAQPGPPPNRIYALEGRAARIPVEAGAGLDWAVQDEAGRVVRAWGAAEADAALRVPAGGWYRLLRRDAAGEVRAAGGRFAAGLVVLVTGQSQAEHFFSAAPPTRTASPAAPPVAAWAQDCTGSPGCGAAGLAWTALGEAPGGRMLLAELARHLGPVPLALANAAWGGASAAELADPAEPAGARLRRVAAGAAPASAALILAHGTTDAFRGTPAAAYEAALDTVQGVLRAALLPGAPVLQAPLPPLLGHTRLLGSGRLAAWLLPPEGAPGWTLRLGLAARRDLPRDAAAGAAAVRAAQARAADRFGLGDGGDLGGIAPGLDGIHWAPAGEAAAAREVAASLARALRAP